MTIDSILSALDSMESSVLSLESLEDDLESKFVHVALLVETRGPSEETFWEDDVVKLADVFAYFRKKRTGEEFISRDRCETLYMKTWAKTYKKEMGTKEEPADVQIELDWRRFNLPWDVVVRVAKASACHHAAQTKAYFRYAAANDS